MKKLLLTFAILGTLICLVWQQWGKDDIRLKTKENEAQLHISAKFPTDKTSKVQQFLTKEMNDPSMTFNNTEIDGDVRLNDGTELYLRLKEGSLKIILERSKNSEQSYLRIKKISNKLKDILTR
jgi:hypothetical protein